MKWITVICSAVLLLVNIQANSTSASYVGYDGGLRLIEKLYSYAFNRGNLSSRTFVE